MQKSYEYHVQGEALKKTCNPKGPSDMVPGSLYFWEEALRLYHNFPDMLVQINPPMKKGWLWPSMSSDVLRELSTFDKIVGDRLFTHMVGWKGSRTGLREVKKVENSLKLKKIGVAVVVISLLALNIA